MTRLNDKSLDELGNFCGANALTEEMAEKLETALKSFREIIAQLKK